MEMFITIASSIYAVLFTAWVILICVTFARLTPFEQHRARIKVGSWSIIVYILSISWIISRFIG